MKPRDPSEPAPKDAASTPARRARRKPAGLLGLGLDGSDGHGRVTRGDDFLLVGGSEATHERMQDLVLRMDEKLKRRGKRFSDLSRSEFEDLARDSVR